MEINDTTMSIFVWSRWFGEAPYTIVRNNRNQIINFELNRAICIYSLTLAIFLFCLTNYLIIHELNMGRPVR